jgi:hypothetical protein
LVKKSDGKKPLVRSRRGWENNNKMYVEEVVFKGVECIDVAHDREWSPALVNMAINLGVP